MQQAILNLLEKIDQPNTEAAELAVSNFFIKYQNVDKLNLVAVMKQDLQDIAWPENAGEAIQKLLLKVTNHVEIKHLLHWIALHQALYQAYLEYSTATFSHGKFPIQNIFLMQVVCEDFIKILDNAQVTPSITLEESVLTKIYQAALQKCLINLYSIFNKLSKIGDAEAVIKLTGEISDKRGIIDLYEQFNGLVKQCYEIKSLEKTFKKIYQLRKLMFEFLTTEEIFVDRCQSIQKEKLTELIRWYLDVDRSQFAVPDHEAAIAIYMEYEKILGNYAKITNGLRTNYFQLACENSDFDKAVEFIYHTFTAAKFYSALGDYFIPVIQQYPNLTRLLARIQNDISPSNQNTINLIRQSQDALAEPFQRVPRYGLIAENLLNNFNELLKDGMAELLITKESLGKCQEQITNLHKFFKVQAKNINESMPSEEQTLSTVLPYGYSKIKPFYIQCLTEQKQSLIKQWVEESQITLLSWMMNERPPSPESSPKKQILQWIEKTLACITKMEDLMQLPQKVSLQFTAFSQAMSVEDQGAVSENIDVISTALKKLEDFGNNPLFYRAYTEEKVNAKDEVAPLNLKISL